jgi:DNA-binding transcriptional LysR family regulator
LPLFEYFSAAADMRSSVRVNPVANHFAAAEHGLGLALLAIPFAQAEGLVQVLPTETALTNVWLLRRRESDLRRLTREVRKFLEDEFTSSRPWFAGDLKVRKTSRRRSPSSAQS